MARTSKELQRIGLFVANLMNDEQKAHSLLISSLRASAGKTNEFNNMVAILSQVYDAKMQILEKIYKETQVP